MFFFFEQAFKPGVVCRVIGGSDEGKMVVVHQIFENMLWCYDNRPVTHRINRKGQKVIDFDPACVLSPYSPGQLEVTNDIPLQQSGWGERYRRARMY
jgi:hypothetical protein